MLAKVGLQAGYGLLRCEYSKGNVLSAREALPPKNQGNTKVIRASTGSQYKIHESRCAGTISNILGTMANHSNFRTNP